MFLPLPAILLFPLTTALQITVPPKTITAVLPSSIAYELGTTKQSISFIKFDEHTTLQQIYTEYHHTTNHFAEALLKLNREGFIPNSCVVKWFTDPIVNLRERILIVKAVDKIKRVDSSLNVSTRIGIIEVKRDSMGLSLLEFTHRVIMATISPDYREMVLGAFSFELSRRNALRKLGAQIVSKDGVFIRVNFPLIERVIGSTQYSFIKITPSTTEDELITEYRYSRGEQPNLGNSILS
jgi:hypothetical protein